MPSRGSRSRRMLTVAIGVAVAAGALLFGLVVFQAVQAEAAAGVAILAGAAGLVLVLAASCAYVLLSIRGFARAAAEIMESIEQGNYRAARSHHPDELHGLIPRLNETIERLRVVDRLRARRVGLAFRVVRLLHQRMKAPAMIADPRANAFTLNEAFRELYGVDQDTLAVDAVLNASGNEAFRDLYNEALFGSRRPQTGDVDLALPRGSARRLHVEIVPVRGEEDTIARALVFASEDLAPPKPAGSEDNASAPADAEPAPAPPERRADEAPG